MNTEHAMGGALFIGGLVLLTVLWLASIVWSYRDAKRRGKSGLLVALMVFLLPWPAGVIAWLIFRPRDYAHRPISPAHRR